MKTATKTWVGAIWWVAYVVLLGAYPTRAGWSHALLLFAAFVLMPLVLDLIAERRDAGSKTGRLLDLARRAQLPAALLLNASLVLKTGPLAAAVSLGWFAFTILLAVYGVGRVRRDGWSRPPDRLAGDIGLIYLALGGLWVVIERLWDRPVGMNRELVEFGSVYLYVIGLLLPVLSGTLLRQVPESRFGTRGMIGSVLTIPALALGAFVAAPGWTPALEAAAGIGLAMSAGMIAILHVRWALDTRDARPAVRLLIGTAGTALAFAVIPAAVYAIRAFVPLMPELGLAQIRLIHGTLITFGFGLCGVLGWRLRGFAANEELRMQNGE